MRLSIIVPVYNVEPYVERCLRSLINQDIPSDEYEIIVVNDGSPDNSRDIVVKLQQETGNIILIDQENQGVSVARNIGLAHANGSYALFVDADDYVVENSLQLFLQFAESKKLEILYMGFQEKFCNGRTAGEADYTNQNFRLFGGVETYHLTRNINNLTTDRSCAILYNKHFLNKFYLKFIPGILMNEDAHFVGKVLSLANQCSFCDKPFYIYEKRPGSASSGNKRNDINRTKGFLIATKDLITFKKSYLFDEDQLKLINHLIAKFTLTAVMSAASTKSIQILKMVKIKLTKYGVKKLDTKGLSKLRTYTIIYNLSFWAFVAFYVLESRIHIVKNKFNSRQLINL